ncbi:MAG TPA: SgcJ/EcaC family oxidoreductase [Candidatus Angelobacter sp.]|nr:SgcJ/EcaC family oxidoreductase [Candidatus Angelobacter sp.]
MKTSIALASLVLAGALLTRPAMPADQSAQAVQQVPQVFIAAWEQADAPRIASLYAADGDLVIPSGQVISGRNGIQTFYQAAFDRGYRGSHVSSEIRRIRVAGSTAVIDGSWRISGARTDGGATSPDERGLFTAVLEKQSEAWHIMAMREMVPTN